MDPQNELTQEISKGKYYWLKEKIDQEAIYV